MKWFKFYGQDYISDPKMLSLNACQRSCWITLLSYSSINDNGLITYLDEEQLMIQAGVSPMHDEWETTKGVLQKFVNLGMITNDNGLITILNWQKRQETNLTSYERVKRHREKKRNDNKKITLEENRREENRVIKKEELVASLPVWLNQKAWEAWLKHRKEKKKPVTPTSMKLQLRFLEQHKADHAEIIKKSITNGWTGLFPLDEKKNFNKPREPASEEIPIDNNRLREIHEQKKLLTNNFKM